MTKPQTTAHMGRNEMLPRLAAQVGSHELAVKLLQDRGQLGADGKTWTAAGAVRNKMTAEERAKDRAAKASGKPPGAFGFNPRTNSATLKRK